MVETVKKAVKKAAAPQKAAVIPKTAIGPTDIVAVKNIAPKAINTSVGCIQPGETGKATNAELIRWGKFLEKA